MLDMEKHIADFLDKDEGSHYFVACSGGVDSKVLLHILFKLNKRVSAVHVNYMLRDKDSEEDQISIEEICREMKIPCHVKRVDLNRYLNEKGGNLQDEARKVRYSYFETFKVKRDFRIILGQHADDQVETFFLNIARGSGIMGLSCMLPEHNHYLRPLLPFSKEEILAYAKKNKIKWREDSSNLSNKYSRNKLRNVILPELKKGIPTLQESTLFLIDKFQQTQRELERSVEALVKKIKGDSYFYFSDYDQLNEFEIHEIMRQLELPLGIHRELGKLRSTFKGKQIELHAGECQSIIREDDHFYFAYLNSNQGIPTLRLEHVDHLPANFTKDEVYLDPKKIKGNIGVRFWRIGDRINPVGLNGSKLISDILTDAKVPNHMRKQQLVVHDDEKIIWCVGLCVGREAVAGFNSEIYKVMLITSS